MSDAKNAGIMKSSPGSANSRAKNQCQSQMFLAERNAPTAIGRVKRKKRAAMAAATPQPQPNECSIPAQPAASCSRPNHKKMLAKPQPSVLSSFAPLFISPVRLQPFEATHHSGHVG